MQLSVEKGIKIFKDLITNLTFFISLFRSHKEIRRNSMPRILCTYGRWSKTIIKSKKISIYNKFLWAIMKMNRIKDQQEGRKTAKLFHEAMKLVWGLQATYCYHDLIHMIKNDYYYDLYDSDNEWGVGLGAKN